MIWPALGLKNYVILSVIGLTAIGFAVQSVRLGAAKSEIVSLIQERDVLLQNNSIYLKAKEAGDESTYDLQIATNGYIDSSDEFERMFNTSTGDCFATIAAEEPDAEARYKLPERITGRINSIEKRFELSAIRIEKRFGRDVQILNTEHNELIDNLHATRKVK